MINMIRIVQAKKTKEASTKKTKLVESLKRKRTEPVPGNTQRKRR